MGFPKYATRPLTKTHASGTRPKSKERRALTRLPVELEAILIWDGVPRQVTITDLGIGGLFVECPECAPFNTSVLVVLDHAGGPLRLPGIVRWGSEVGMGLQLGLLGARETHAIAALLGLARSAQGKP